MVVSGASVVALWRTKEWWRVGLADGTSYAAFLFCDDEIAKQVKELMFKDVVVEIEWRRGPRGGYQAWIKSIRAAEVEESESEN